MKNSELFSRRLGECPYSCFCRLSLVELPASIISLSVPFRLEDKDQTFPSYLPKIPTSLSTVFNQSTPEGVASLRWALERGRPVDVDIQAPISDAVLESFEDIISRAIAGLEKVPPIVLCEFAKEPPSKTDNLPTNS